MGKLTDEQAKALADLQALADAPDDDGFEVWVKSGEHEARIPSSKAGGWLKEKFGIDLNPATTSDGGGDEGDDAPKDKQPTKGYFGKRT